MKLKPPSLLDSQPQAFVQEQKGLESVSPEDLASKATELKAAHVEQQEQQELRAFVLTSSLQSFQRVFLDNGLTSRMQSIADTAREYLTPKPPSAELHDLAAVQPDGSPATVSQMALAFLQAPDQHVLLIRCPDAQTAAQAVGLLHTLQWSYFDAHSRMMPLVIDLAALPAAVGDPVGETLLRHGYCAAAADALRRENPGMLLIFSNWSAAQHCTNIHARAELAKWASVGGAAPKAIFVVTEHELAASLGQAQESNEDEALSDKTSSANPRLWGSGPEGTAALYFMPSNAIGQPLPSALNIVKTTGQSQGQPADFVGQGAVFCEARRPNLETDGDAAQNKGDAGHAQANQNVVVQHVIQRCHRAVLRVRSGEGVTFVSGGPQGILSRHLVC